MIDPDIETPVVTSPSLGELRNFPEERRCSEPKDEARRLKLIELVEIQIEAWKPKAVRCDREDERRGSVVFGLIERFKADTEKLGAKAASCDCPNCQRVLDGIRRLLADAFDAGMEFAKR